MIGFYHLAPGSSAGKPTLVSWYKFEINLETIDTKKVKIALRKAPMVSESQQAKDALSDDTCLVVEVAISRRLNVYNMTKVRRQLNSAPPTLMGRSNGVK